MHCRYLYAIAFVDHLRERSEQRGISAIVRERPKSVDDIVESFDEHCAFADKLVRTRGLRVVDTTRKREHRTAMIFYRLSRRDVGAALDVGFDDHYTAGHSADDPVAAGEVLLVRRGAEREFAHDRAAFRDLIE